jgi:hypothetical protein
MSVSIYKIGGSGATTGVLKGVHSLVNLEAGLQTSQCMHSSPLTTITCTTDAVISAPYIPAQSFSINSVSLFVTTIETTKLARVMIYSNTDVEGTAGLPDLLLSNTADFSLGSLGKISSGMIFNFIAGTTYWIAVQTNSSVAVLSAIPVGNLLCIANKSNFTPISVYTGSRIFSAGAQDPFSNYASAAYSTISMPLVSLNV